MGVLCSHFILNMKEVEQISLLTENGDLKFSANSGLPVLYIMFKSAYFALRWEY